jgi:hypothetical protein
MPLTKCQYSPLLARSSEIELMTRENRYGERTNISSVCQGTRKSNIIKLMTTFM